MDRNEILRRAQENNGPDEREAKAQRESFSTAYIAGMITALAFMILKIIMDQPWQDVYAVIIVMMAVQNFSLWFNLRKRKMTLVSAILFAITSILLIINYCLNIF